MQIGLIFRVSVYPCFLPSYITAWDTHRSSTPAFIFLKFDSSSLRFAVVHIALLRGSVCSLHVYRIVRRKHSED
jgi:hypothetical protein